MNKTHCLLKTFKIFGLGLVFLAGLTACASGTTIGTIAGDSWKEEVLLHDGSKMIVKRSQSYGGSHEIGQPLPVSEHIVSFTLPKSGKSYTWKSEYGAELGRTNFNLLAIHVLDNTPYIITTPNLCLSYNKWGRPNPPYVIFRHDGNAWQRIQMSELPQEFKTLNVLIGIREEDTRGISSMRTISAETIKARNAELRQPELKTIQREAIMGGEGITSCEELVPYGKGGWLGLDWFSDQPSYEACSKFCDKKDVNSIYCPCNKLFKGK